ncbi:MAG: N-acetylmuramoyl-L-alanine amidase [Tissierellia bacterium]|nr:N-acetylmuramoyl-L-alanine amidase [Tissierellia bacterium]
MKRKPKVHLVFISNKRIILAIIILALLIGTLVNYSYSRGFSIFNFLEHDVIVVDPGHGGIDGGTGNKNDVLEKDVNLDIALKLKKELLIEGFKVVLTREQDVSLEGLSNIKASRYRRDLDARKNIINGNDPVAFVSIHCNSSTSTVAKGIKIYHYPDSIEGEKLAKCISEEVDEIIYREYLNEDNLRSEVLSEDFYILREPDYTGVLIEVGFLTNPEEKKLLVDEEYQQIIARAIKKGILKYLK